ncbi:hypothetical protein AAH211_01385 [Serratia fonticola]|uniref:hypothetical protein n=1 Tax=Serratia fonticola TaxID=47917 RepID=UPI003986128B
MDIKLTFYRYYQVIDRGNKSIKLSISILTVWLAVFFLFLKMNSISIHSSSGVGFDFDWDRFSLMGVISFCMLAGAFCYGFSATDTEHKGDRDLMNEYLITTNEKFSLTLSTVRTLNEIINHKEGRLAKATALNLIACIFAFGSFVFGFFSADEILSNLRVETFLWGLLISITVLLMIHFGDVLRGILTFKKKDKS